jgi:hypothetical protein
LNNDKNIEQTQGQVSPRYLGAVSSHSYSQKAHKAIHALVTAKPGDDKSTHINFTENMQLIVCHPGEFYNPFPNYAFTGALRPVYPLSNTRKVPDHIPRPDYAEDGQCLSTY